MNGRGHMEVSLSSEIEYNNIEGFMQDQIIASHTRFGGHVDVNCSARLQTLNILDLKWDRNTHVTPFKFISKV